MTKELYKYIKDVTVAGLIFLDGDEKEHLSPNKIFKYFNKAIRNYVALRLKLLQNEKLMKVERAVVTKLIKAGVKYALKEFEVDVGTTDVDKIIDEIMPGVYEDVHNLRVDLFTKLLEISSSCVLKEEK